MSNYQSKILSSTKRNSPSGLKIHILADGIVADERLDAYLAAIDVFSYEYVTTQHNPDAGTYTYIYSY